MQDVIKGDVSAQREWSRFIRGMGEDGDSCYSCYRRLLQIRQEVSELTLEFNTPLGDEHPATFPRKHDGENDERYEQGEPAAVGNLREVGGEKS